MLLSLTSDNGKEFADRELVETQLQIPFFFATPYHSRERPSNENCNRCVRKHLPKRFDFTNVPEEYFEKIEHMINNKPRKIHNYRTPFEVHYNKKTRLLS
jgi:transposase, IS30 family